MSLLATPSSMDELELPAGLSPSTQGTDNPAVTGDKCSELHLHFRLAFCKSGPKLLGLKLWSSLQEMACKKRHPNIESLKRFLRKVSANFKVDVLHNSIYGWPQRLKDCVLANGGHFE